MSENGITGDRLLPPELVRGLRLLEGRLELLHVRTRRVRASEWASLPDDVTSLVPPWLKAIGQEHALVGAVLEIRDPRRNYARCLSFYDPADYRVILQADSLWRQVMEFGFFPFANEANGDAWVVELAKGPESAVHLLELSGWGGGPPARRNGLEFACSRLELLLAHMAISPATYDEAAGTPRCIKWFPS